MDADATTSLAEPTAGALPAEPAPQLAHAARARLLVADDDPMNLLAFAAVLEPLGHEVVRVTSGEAALRELLHADFAVVLLDVHMPGMDGFETASLIRRRRRSANVPIIFLTGISKQETHVRRGYSLGAVDYLFKPVEPDFMRAKVQVFLDLYEQRQQARRQSDRIHALEREHLLARERARSEAERLRLQQAANTKLETMARELERSNHELEQFAYIASHDLQEPLRMVASFARLLEEQYAGALDERGSEWLHHVGDGARRMQNLVRDLLALSRVGSEATPRQGVALVEVVTDALADLRASVESSSARVVVGELPRLVVDRRQLTQVFQNLIGNALKFRADAVPEIAVQARLCGDEWVLTVTDNGIGIAPELRDRVFGMFQRLHARGRFEGTGLGLAIVQKVVQAHGGRVWVESAPGTGSRFCFTLPRG